MNARQVRQGQVFRSSCRRARFLTQLPGPASRTTRVHVEALSRPSLRLSLRLGPTRETFRSPKFQVSLGQPSARLDQLDNVDDLLEGHDGEADTSNHPRPKAIHLIGSRQLERTRAVRIREDLSEERLVDLGSLVHGRGIGHLLQQARGQQRAGERKKVQRDEEGLVQRTAHEQNSLVIESIYSFRAQAPKTTHLVGVILVQDPAPGLVDGFVTRIRTTHGFCGHHVNIVRGKVE
jgi:hypothetical protein